MTTQPLDRGTTSENTDLAGPARPQPCVALRLHPIAFPTLPTSRLSVEACVRCLELRARPSLHHDLLRHSTRIQRTTLPQRVVYSGARRACWQHHSCMSQPSSVWDTFRALHHQQASPLTACLKWPHTCRSSSTLPSIQRGLANDISFAWRPASLLHSRPCDLYFGNCVPEHMHAPR